MRVSITLVLYVAVLLPASFAFADETYTFDKEITAPTVYFDKAAWLTTLHPKIATFTAQSNGNAYGLTTTGVPFKQYSISSEENVRVQKFEIQDHFHFIVEGVIIGSLEALSVQLASVYSATH